MHYAISKANLQMILTLLNSKEIKNFNVLDRNGKKAQSLVPYSSPIYKLIKKITNYSELEIGEN